MAAAIYILCFLTALACFGLLLRAWLRTRASFLFWCALCFAGLAANNVILVIDKLVLPDVSLALPRVLIALVATLLLVYGLLSEE
ncbi:DUF5985 family protein [Ramlibacter sp.]|uniref:DUF5985 family protein n=1 Tax=Ramlibacter sp. TaxID=1917967 RepID=UPI00180A665B|nr:DUF5985 family protein [Ramlibacter sp.]MBA2672443.1 hypothetical protein [Ramlibacter sp.]